MNEKLNNLYELISAVGDQDITEEGFLDVGNPSYDVMATLAEELFIGENGNPDYDTIGEFCKFKGVDVGPGETDAFGWLTGVVYGTTKSGARWKFVFG